MAHFLLILPAFLVTGPNFVHVGLMKCTRKQINDDGSGLVTLIPQEQEDLWHVVNLITIGDLLKASTWRCVTQRAFFDW